MRLLFGLLAAALWLTASLAHANSAKPWRDGQDPEEAVEPLEGLVIEREVLTIDARPLVAEPRIEVTARYEVRNDGASLTTPLVFVSPGVAAGVVTLDGESVWSAPQSTDGMPEPWRGESKTPNPEGGEGIPFSQSSGALTFTATFEPGVHVLEVRYEFRPSEYYGRRLKDFQFAYNLAPARHWGGFGTLEVVVETPPMWDVVAEPELERVDGAWRATFEGVPTDSLGMTIVPRAPVRALIPAVLTVLGLLAVVMISVAMGRAVANRTAGWLLVPLLVLGGGIGMGTARAAGMGAFAAAVGASLVAPDTDYDDLLLAALFVVIGAVVAPIAFAIGKRRAR